MSLASATLGPFITFEGPEGSGKSLQAGRLARFLLADGRRVVLTREPGGTPLGDEIRRLALLKSELNPVPRAEALLMCAARAQLVETVIRPAIARGEVVVCDRFGDSTLAYQGSGRGLDVAAVAQTISFATQHLVPDLTILLDVPVGVGLERKATQLAGSGRELNWNRFEGEELAFHERVRSSYLAMANADPIRWAVFDGGKQADQLTAAIRAVIASRVPALRPR